MAKILIIEDDGIVRDALSVFLIRGGHQVLSASDGANGVQLFKLEAPDLVILDRNLPLVSGSGVFEQIRKISNTAPVVILTGYDSPEEADIYLKHGAAAFLSKGDGLSSALAKVEEVLAKGGLAAAPSPVSAKPLVLIADDDEGMLDVMSRCMRGAGYEVITAADGLAAERLALERRPDIVLLDIFMPGKDGVEVLKTLRAALPLTGVMMVSGNDDEELAKACLTKGAFDYITKPPNLEAVESTVKGRLLVQRGRI